MTAARLAWYALNLVFGVGVSLTGVWFTLQAIGQQETSGVFNAPCQENSYFVGSRTGGDAYSPSNETAFYQNFYLKTCGKGGDITCSQYGACS